jgi:chitodextrinase
MQDAGVPILFRPWHEMNGYWFWWGKKNNLAGLWNLTYDRFVNEHGLNNILWVWNPNCMKATDPNIGDFKLYYPGHSRVDVLAWDIYLGEFSQVFHDELFTFGGGKPIALGEVGGLPNMNVMKSSQWKYTWAMAWGEPNFSNENTTANKQQFYSHSYAITRDEVDIPNLPDGPPDTIAPTVPSNVTVSAKSHTSVSLSWSASTDNIAVTGYDILQDGTVIGSTTTATSYNVTGLSPRTTYIFTVRAKDAAGNVSSESTAVSVTTDEAPDVEEPVFVKGINLNGSTATIEGNTWLAESAAGIITSTVKRSVSNISYKPASDSQTNTMLNRSIYNNNSFSVTQSLLNGDYEVYLWSTENYKPNFRSFHVKLEGKQVTSNPIGSMPLNEWRKHGPYSVTVSDGTLNLELVRVSGDPALSGMVIYTQGTIVTPPEEDEIAPSVPSNVSVVTKTHSSVTLTWNASTDNVGVTGYDIMQEGAVIGSTTTATNYKLTGLTPSTTYSFTVRAKDAAGNLSPESTPVKVTTDREPDVGIPIFVKGINLNGTAATIEGNVWLAESGAGLTTSTVKRNVSNISYKPATDSQTNTMLNRSIYSDKTFSFSQALVNGSYEVYLWSTENYKPHFRSFHVKLEGKQVTTNPIGLIPLNEWRKYGPYAVTVSDGVLNMELVRVTGDPGLAGMAIYKR